MTNPTADPHLPADAREAGRTAAMLENIAKAVDALTTKLDPVPGALLTIQSTLTNLTTTVTGHDVTLYGEKNENGLVGEVSSLKKEFREFKGALAWVAGIFAVLVAGLLWAIFTGQITLVTH